MDSLILRNFELLRAYAALQQTLNKQSSGAHIALSRVRYNGVKIGPDAFRATLTPYVYVSHVPDLPENTITESVTLSQKRPAGVSDTDDKEKTENSQEVDENSAARTDETDVENLIDAVTATRITNGDHPSQSEQTEDAESSSKTEHCHEQSFENNEENESSQQEDEEEDIPSSKASDDTFYMHGLKTSDVKKDNPIRSIEGLPSPALKTTQTAFHEMLKTAVTLGDVFSELQTVQSLLGLHETCVDATNKHDVESLRTARESHQ